MHWRRHGLGRSATVCLYYCLEGWKSLDTDYWEAGPLRSSLQDQLQQLQPWCILHSTTMQYRTVLAGSEILDIAYQGDGLESDLGTCTITLSVRYLACREKLHDHLEHGTRWAADWPYLATSVELRGASYTTATGSPGLFVHEPGRWRDEPVIGRQSVVALRVASSIPHHSWRRPMIRTLMVRRRTRRQRHCLIHRKGDKLAPRLLSTIIRRWALLQRHRNHLMLQR